MTAAMQPTTDMSLYNDCSGQQENCPCIKLCLLRSAIAFKCNDWVPTSLSLHCNCPYKECSDIAELNVPSTFDLNSLDLPSMKAGRRRLLACLHIYLSA